MTRRCLVRVPASSANLGAGFDCLAIALALHLELEVLEAESFAVETDLPLPHDRSNLCVRAFERLGAADGLRFCIRSQIPLAGGLGSSAAAIVAGMMAAQELLGADVELLDEASAMEGHPDNVAGALLGGFVVCAEGRAFRTDVPAGLEAVLVVPDEHVRTSAARAALPAAVPREDAVFNIGHACLLTLGLARGDHEMIARGLHDRLHEAQRSDLYPRSYELAQRLPALGAIGASISGAGATVLAWSTSAGADELLEVLGEETSDWARPIRVPFEQRGAHALPAE